MKKTLLRKSGAQRACCPLNGAGGRGCFAECLWVKNEKGENPNEKIACNRIGGLPGPDAGGLRRRASSTPASGSASGSTAAAVSGDANVAVFYYTYSDTYISSVRSALDAKLDEMGVTYQDFDGAGQQTTQTEQVKTAITNGATVLLVNLVETASDDAANEIVSAAKTRISP